MATSGEMLTDYVKDFDVDCSKGCRYCTRECGLNLDVDYDLDF